MRDLMIAPPSQVRSVIIIAFNTIEMVPQSSLSHPSPADGSSSSELIVPLQKKEQNPGATLFVFSVYPRECRTESNQTFTGNYLGSPGHYSILSTRSVEIGGALQPAPSTHSMLYESIHYEGLDGAPAYLH